jgi:subtilisin family serine protease
MHESRINRLLSLCAAVTALLPFVCSAALPPHVAGEVLVSFKSGVGAATVMATQPGIATMKRVGASVYNIHLQPDATVEGMLAKLQGNPLVATVQPNYIKRLQTYDTYYDQQWGLKNTGQNGGQPGADISIESAWGVTRGDRDTVVAVIDTGIAAGQPDLQHQLWQNPHEIPNGSDTNGNGIVDDIIGADFSDLNYIDGSPFDSIDGHGTLVAGIIAAEADNDEGISGVAPGVSLMIIKAFNGGVSSTSNVVAAIDYAIDNGADIINASYGQIGVKDYGARNFDLFEYNAIKRARDAGILYVTAAGNGCTNADPTSSNYDASCPYDTQTGMGYDNDHPPDPGLGSFVPASYDLANIIAVAATDRNDALTDFSNYGASTVDLAAPGKAIMTTYLVDSANSANSYVAASGTSVAVPFVSGTLALMWSAGDHNWRSLRDRLLLSVDGLPELSGKLASGGRLNAAAALAAPSVATASAGGGGGGPLGLLSLLVLTGACLRRTS